VCLAANELDLAIDVYRQMQAEGCKPNLVTYNTLIDVYGKTGAWEDAVAALDVYLEYCHFDPALMCYDDLVDYYATEVLSTATPVEEVEEA